jgi:two-component system sensor histidine kinase LytS
MTVTDPLVSFQKVCLLVTLTYFASRTDAFARLMLQNARRKDRLLSYLFFTTVALAEVVIAPHNSLMDARIVAATAAGLLGGMTLGTSVGITTGFMSMVHSPWAPLDCVPAVVAGVLGGAFYRYRPAFAAKVLAGFLAGTLGHGLWLVTRLQTDYLVGSWDVLAVQYVLPMFASGVGVSVFLAIIGDIRAQRERIERSELAKAIAMANRVLPGPGTGLDTVAAKHLAEMVRRFTGAPAVAIAVEGKLLAHVGEASDYHSKSGIIPDVAIQAMRDGERHYTEKRATWCNHAGCPFGSAVAAPLQYREKIVGSVVLYETRNARFRPEVVDLGAEVAQFLVNYRLQTVEIAEQARAVSKAELKALQAQVHPHFLFNALNTLAGLCEMNPRAAAELTVRLGEFFRGSFRSERELLSTVREELAVARSYLDIEKARFGERLEVVEDTDPAADECSLPSFSLQPLVENAIVHGVSRKTGKGIVTISTRVDDGHLWCSVTDNGRGFDVKSIDWRNNGTHALGMLSGRLKRIYGDDYELAVQSTKGHGTRICIEIPVSKQ